MTSANQKPLVMNSEDTKNLHDAVKHLQTSFNGLTFQEEYPDEKKPLSFSIDYRLTITSKSDKNARDTYQLSTPPDAPPLFLMYREALGKFLKPLLQVERPVLKVLHVSDTLDIEALKGPQDVEGLPKSAPQIGAAAKSKGQSSKPVKEKTIWKFIGNDVNRGHSAYHFHKVNVSLSVPSMLVAKTDDDARSGNKLAKPINSLNYTTYIRYPKGYKISEKSIEATSSKYEWCKMPPGFLVSYEGIHAESGPDDYINNIFDDTWGPEGWELDSEKKSSSLVPSTS